jgi:hypothetical protein
MAVLFPRTRLAAEDQTWAEDLPRSIGGEMPQITTQEVEFTAEGTLLETLRVVDVNNPVVPVRLRVREWIDERHYRDVDVPEDPIPDFVPEWLAA